VPIVRFTESGKQFSRPRVTVSRHFGFKSTDAILCNIYCKYGQTCEQLQAALTGVSTDKEAYNLDSIRSAEFEETKKHCHMSAESQNCEAGRGSLC
jgi:hypothetical protein